MFDRNNYGELGLFFCFLLSLHSLSCLYFFFFQLNSTRREIGRERKIRDPKRPPRLDGFAPLDDKF